MMLTYNLSIDGLDLILDVNLVDDGYWSLIPMSVFLKLFNWPK